jgi:multiple sugar transport system permease protein
MRPHSHRTALLFLAPNLLGFATFTLVPVLLSLAGSFTNWSLRPATKLRFVGWDNYARLFEDKNFWFYLYNTGYLLLALPFAIGGALFLAVQLHDGFAFRRARRGPRLAAGALAIALVSAVTLALTGSPNLAYVSLALGVIAAAGLAFGAVAYRTVFYLPHFTAGAATILLWTQLYNPNFGLLKNAL